MWTKYIIQEEDVAERIEELYGAKGVSVVFAKDFQQSLDMLENDRVAAVAGDETKLSYLINQQRSNRYYKFLKYSFSRKEICVALNKDNEGLLNAFNKAVLSMKKKNLITKTQSKWFGAMEPEITDMTEVDVIYNIGFFFIICGAAFTIWNLSTAKKVTEKTRELFNSKEQLRLIIDTLDRGLIIASGSGTILEVNDEICRIAGCSKRELLKSDIHTNKWVMPYLQQEDETVYKLKEHYYMKNTMDLNEEDKKLYIVEEWTQRYINERRNIQEEKMIAVGQLSAGLAHEIRNPLGLIKSYMFLIQDFVKGEDGIHAVRVIDDSIKRINRLIDSLLKFSRLSGEDNKEVDIGELISNILILEKKQMDSKDIDVTFSLNGEKAKPVLLNEDLLKITMINLLNNSIDALAEVERKRKIEIRVTIWERTVNIVFRDNGCGIESERLSEIFNPFYTSKERGTGLGLYLVHSQLEQAGGAIRAESVRGEGSVFYVEIPVKMA
ncbi:ATP-binding protein [Anaerotruncus sp. 80]